MTSGGSCRDHFESLLALEWAMPGGPGELPHFYAVAAYGLQHPRAMNYTIEGTASLREAVADALLGHASMEELRRRARLIAKQAGRVTRRTGDQVAGSSSTSWPMTIVDVLPAGADDDAYAIRVARWARSVIDTLDSIDPEG